MCGTKSSHGEFYPLAFGYGHNASGGTKCRLWVLLCARLLSKRCMHNTYRYRKLWTRPLTSLNYSLLGLGENEWPRVPKGQSHEASPCLQIYFGTSVFGYISYNSG